ncbi:PREDICTED: protein BCCIP homolog [Ceratosolen solmsi marchali]|uniref:Protein BCCIP homolog n=1 Tax=Ceratosolen solmsi marchali TaxID=326594 RepID=A0AAJ6YFT1_9HYME|nr:PREDICTED: protein BCCIP homolog [Ceratosolen solmsi marchali]
MATPNKKRGIQRKNNEKSNKIEIEESEVDFVEEDTEIQVDFEGHIPQDPDFHGIKTLLQQLFLKAQIDLCSLTNLIISQNYIGSVVKQSPDFQESDNEDMNDVFSITTVVNLSDKRNDLCIQQLRNLLKNLTNEYAMYPTNAIIQNVLENDSIVVGLLINERIVNIPVQISIPLLENLISEIESAINKNMPFHFTYYILICKQYKINKENQTKQNKFKGKDTIPESNIIWSNPEEEIFAQEATCSFEFNVQKETDSALSGRWTENDYEMIPYRQVLLIKASKLQQILEKIKIQLS